MDELKSKILNTVSALNQGNTGYCTAYALAGYIQSTALLLGKPVPEIDPLEVFKLESEKSANYFSTYTAILAMMGENSPFPIQSMSQVQKVPYYWHGGYRDGIIKAIDQSHLVLIAIRADVSLLDTTQGTPAKTGIWNPPAQDWWLGTHAAFVKGYDLNKTEDCLMQSTWGQSYGQDGCVWFPMDAEGSFSRIVTDAFVLNLFDQEPVNFDEPKVQITVPSDIKPKTETKVVEEKTHVQPEYMTYKVTVPFKEVIALESVAKFNNWHYEIL